MIIRSRIARHTEPALARYSPAYGFEPYNLPGLVAWYQLSDAATLFQDDAGATPVTATGQSLGRLADKTAGAYHATQATAAKRPVLPAAGYRLRSDFVDDAITATWPASEEAWVNTPYGHYVGRASIGACHLPLNDSTEVVVSNAALTDVERAGIGQHFATSRRFGVFLSPDTTVTLNLYTIASEPAPEVLFVGANGMSVTKTWTKDYAATTMDLSVDGLTAPMAVVLLSTLRAREMHINGNNFVGSLPTLNPNMTHVLAHTNKITGCIPNLSANAALVLLHLSDNQLSGTIPTLANTALGTAYLGNNQLTGVDAGFAVPASLGTFGAATNSLSQSAIDAILAAFDAAGRSSGTLSLGGAGNAAPSAAGIASKDSLIAKGWTVTTN